MYNVVNPLLHHPHHHHLHHHLPLPRHHLVLPEWMDQWDHKDHPDQMAPRGLPGPSDFQALSVFPDFPGPQQVPPDVMAPWDLQDPPETKARQAMLDHLDLPVFPVLQAPQLHHQCQALAQSCVLTHASDPARRHVAVAEYLKTSCV